MVCGEWIILPNEVGLSATQFASANGTNFLNRMRSRRPPRGVRRSRRGRPKMSCAQAAATVTCQAERQGPGLRRHLSRAARRCGQTHPPLAELFLPERTLPFGTRLHATDLDCFCATHAWKPPYRGVGKVIAC